MIRNPHTDEEIEFEVRRPEILVMQSTWTRPGDRALEHVHPQMEERFEILEGRAAFRIRGMEKTAGAGEVVVVSPGEAHLAWNPTDDRVRLRITMRPALRWAEFAERLFAGGSRRAAPAGHTRSDSGSPPVRALRHDTWSGRRGAGEASSKGRPGKRAVRCDWRS
jgi:quercetin dioxygenase-like cupin family protein